MKGRILILALLLTLGVPPLATAGWKEISVTVKRPAKYTLTGVQRIKVAKFRSKSADFADLVSSTLTRKLLIAGQGRFEVSDVANDPALLAHQQLVENGIVDESAASEVVKQVDADALIVGTIDNTSKVSSAKSHTPVTKYKEKTKEEYVAKCPTTTQTGHLGVTIQLVKKDGQVIVNERGAYDVVEKNIEDSRPSDPWLNPDLNVLQAVLVANPFEGSVALSSPDVLQQELAGQAAEAFIKSILPYDEQVVIKWDTVIGQEDVYNLVNVGMVDVATNTLGERVPELEKDQKFVKNKHKLAALYYDLGALYEVQGNLDQAKQWYGKAVMADAKSPDQVLKTAIQRVQQRFAEEQRVQEQVVR